MRNVKLYRRALIGACAWMLAVVGSSFVAAEPKAGQETKKAPKKEAAKVYTNQDLKAEDKTGGRTYTNADLPPENSKPAAPAEQDRAFTNEDLSRMFPEPPAPAPAEEAAPPAEAPAETAAPEESEAPAEPPPAAEDSPLGLLEEQERARELNARVAERIEKSLVAARERLQNLETQLLAVSNPFAARPKLSPEEEEYRATTKETGVERRERTEKLVEDARLEVARLEQQLADLRSR